MSEVPLTKVLETYCLMYRRSVHRVRQQMVQMVQSILPVESGQSWENLMQCRGQATVTAAMSEKLLQDTNVESGAETVTGARVAVDASVLIAVLKVGVATWTRSTDGQQCTLCPTDAMRTSTGTGTHG